MTDAEMRLVSTVLVGLVLMAATTGVVSAQQAGSSAQATPVPLPNAVVLSTPYPSVAVDKKDKITFTVNVANGTPDEQSFDLVIAQSPQGWGSLLKSRGFVVRKMYLPPGKTDSLDLEVRPPDQVEPQDYNFLIKAVDSSGKELSNLRLTAAIQQQQTSGVKLVTQYPVLRGPSKNKFQFKVDLTNQADEDRNYSLSATAPDDWQVTFKPAYEETQITSISMKTGDTKTVTVEIQPNEKAAAGDYSVKVQAAGGGDRADVDLKVTLTGTYDMSLSTLSGRLNAQTTAGEQSSFTMVVRNTGSADLQKISLSSSKPDGWDVNFFPDNVAALAPGASQQVQVNVKPAAKAIAGDYMLTLTANAQQSSTSKSVDVRTTVETSSVWGWLGAGIIVLVIGGLFVVFRVFGRR